MVDSRHPVPEKSLCCGEAAVYAQFMTVQAKILFARLTMASGISLLLYCQARETPVTNPHG
jgi:hypothetical protein